MDTANVQQVYQQRGNQIKSAIMITYIYIQQHVG